MEQQVSLLKVVEEALNRSEHDLTLLRRDAAKWEQGEDGMWDFKGFLDPFLVRKYTFNFLREVWHIGDALALGINEIWEHHNYHPPKDAVFKPKDGPGMAVVKLYVRAHRDLALCGDLANLSKHYSLTRATFSGDTPSFGDTAHSFSIPGGKIEYGQKSDTGLRLRVEKPAACKIVVPVLDSKGNEVGNAIDIGIGARDAWLGFCKQKFGWDFLDRRTSAQPDTVKDAFWTKQLPEPPPQNKAGGSV